MICDDLREWIDLLRDQGELAEVDAEVDPYLEITEIADRTMKAGGPALLFRNVRGSQHPLLINQFGTERRMCLALGVERLDDVARQARRRPRADPAAGHRRQAARARQAQEPRRLRAEDRLARACQEIVLDAPDLDRLPIMTAGRRTAGRSSRCPR